MAIRDIIDLCVLPCSTLPNVLLLPLRVANCFGPNNDECAQLDMGPSGGRGVQCELKDVAGGDARNYLVIRNKCCPRCTHASTEG